MASLSPAMRPRVSGISGATNRLPDSLSSVPVGKPVKFRADALPRKFGGQDSASVWVNGCRQSALTLRPSSQKLSVVEKDSSMSYSPFSQASQNAIDFIHPIGFQFGFYFPGGNKIHNVDQVSGIVLRRAENRSLFE